MAQELLNPAGNPALLTCWTSMYDFNRTDTVCAASGLQPPLNPKPLRKVPVKSAVLHLVSAEIAVCPLLCCSPGRCQPQAGGCKGWLVLVPMRWTLAAVLCRQACSSNHLAIGSAAALLFTQSVTILLHAGSPLCPGACTSRVIHEHNLHCTVLTVG
jgi:hypothetical protein